MTFAALEESVQGSRNVELYEIVVGNTTFRFTNSDQSVLFSAQTFVPTPTSREQHKVDQDQPGSELVLKFPTNHPAVSALTRQWVAKAPETGETRVRAWKGHRGDVDEEFQLFWIGYLVSSNYSNKGLITEFKCKSLDNLFTLQGPRKTWGTQCNHEHYDPECTLDPADFTQICTVTAIAADGVTYTVSGVSAPVVRFNSGEFRKQGTLSSRLIVSFTGPGTFVLQFPVPEIEVGDVVEVVEGCEHNLTDCAAFPNAAEASGTNAENYGGTPFTPPLNIFTKGGDAL